MKKILVVGDLMLDKYIFGTVSRISPEAPVPILNMTKTENRLGGAGNVVANIQALDGQSIICGVVGVDKHGIDIYGMLKLCGADVYVRQSDDRKTTVKTRVLSGSHHIVRVDSESAVELNQKDRLWLISAFRMLDSAGLIVISDYRKGVVAHPVVAHLIGFANEVGIPVIVDSKSKDYSRFNGAFMITPNEKEATAATGEKNPEKAGHEIRDRFNIKNVVVTLGKNGMILIGEDGVSHYKSKAKEVFDVSGAGDTVVAALAVGIINGMELPDAMQFATDCAGVVVGKIGTATVSKGELGILNQA